MTSIILCGRCHKNLSLSEITTVKVSEDIFLICPSCLADLEKWMKEKPNQTK